MKLLDDASEALQYNRDLLQSALDQVRHGLSVFDKEMRLICWNRQFRELLELPAEIGRVGAPLDKILRVMAERGDFGNGDIDQLVESRLYRLAVLKETFQERILSGRRHIARTIVITPSDTRGSSGPKRGGTPRNDQATARPAISPMALKGRAPSVSSMRRHSQHAIPIAIKATKQKTGRGATLTVAHNKGSMTAALRIRTMPRRESTQPRATLARPRSLS